MYIYIYIYIYIYTLYIFRYVVPTLETFAAGSEVGGVPLPFPAAPHLEPL